MGVSFMVVSGGFGVGGGDINPTLEIFLNFSNPLRSGWANDIERPSWMVKDLLKRSRS